MSTQSLDQIFHLLKEDMLIKVHNEDIGTDICKIGDIGEDYITVFIQGKDQTYETYAELYLDDCEEQSNFIEIIQ